MLLTELQLHELGYRYPALDELPVARVTRLMRASAIKVRVMHERQHAANAGAPGAGMHASEPTDQWGLTPAERAWMTGFEKRRGLRA